MKIIRVLRWSLLSFLLLNAAALAQGGTALPASRADQIVALQAEVDKVEKQVKTIVNQPVTHLPRSSWAAVQVFSPGWFHAGSTKPDYAKVDVRTTQEFPYTRFEHVSSKLNPHEMFVGSELEFNKNTKYYYTDLNLPKKKLTEAEMVEINRLYRIIGQDTSEITRLQAIWMYPFGSFSEFLNSIFGTLLQLALLSGVGIYGYRRWFA